MEEAAFILLGTVAIDSLYFSLVILAISSISLQSAVNIFFLFLLLIILSMSISPFVMEYSYSILKELIRYQFPNINPPTKRSTIPRGPIITPASKAIITEIITNSIDIIFSFKPFFLATIFSTNMSISFLQKLKNHRYLIILSSNSL
ncbi:MAG: hypothetical protein BWY74_04144 [Firmicutes bacterium ADurb.Bin419]|nr:MAG: hypothetical protein BWY74_04144 [Firmicutes bacterium ADurb.Bin419]